MGKIEENVRRTVRRTRINAAVINCIAAAGVLAIGLVAPNVLGAMGRLGLIGSGRKQNIQKSITRLIRYGYVVVNHGRARLTSRGKELADAMGDDRFVLEKPKRWDGKWRVLVFDIPENKRSLRTHVRHVLASLGFVRLQDSVWVYPYDCEDIIAIFKINRHIGKDMLYMVVDTIENDGHLRSAFSLSPS